MLAVVVVAIVLEPMLCDNILLSFAHLIFVFYVTMIRFFSGFYILYCFPTVILIILRISFHFYLCYRVTL